MNKNKYPCNRCVIEFKDIKLLNKNGLCQYCVEYDEMYKPRLENEKKYGLKKLVKELLLKTNKLKYNAIIGLSGGIDSSFLTCLMKDFGLNCLIVHIDSGWNSSAAYYNIQKVIEYTGFDFETVVLDWDSVSELQKAYYKSFHSNLDAVQDHAFFSALYDLSIKHNIKYFISGGNLNTEAILPNHWHHPAMDSIFLKNVYKKFGGKYKLNFPFVSFWRYYFTIPFVHRLKVLRPLNYIDYNKDEAKDWLIKNSNYYDYGLKHSESIFTKIFQNYILISRHKIDKRTAHLSSLINCGQMTKEEAILELSKPAISERILNQDLQYFKDKISISDKELDLHWKLPNKLPKIISWNYHRKVIDLLKKIFFIISGRSLNKYS